MKVICKHNSISKGLKPYENEINGICNDCGFEWHISIGRYGRERDLTPTEGYKLLDEKIKNTLPKLIQNYTIVDDKTETTDDEDCFV